jgi:hypothetical protein
MATDDDSGTTSSNPFNVVVTPVNDAPTNTVPIAVQQTDPSGAVIFSAANGNQILISDVDAGTGQLTVTLTATHGTMTLNGVTGLTFDPGQDGTADASMTFEGTLDDINIALDGMSFHRDADYTGLANVTIAVDDQGNTGTGGPLSSAPGVADISVEPYDVWFAGFGTEAGWDVYNGSGLSYYTHDYTIFWQHVNATDTWTFYNGTAWVGTDALGNAPYADGFGPYGAWFDDTVVGGVYEGYDVYIGNGVTYLSLDYTAVGTTFWQQTGAGAWSYWDGDSWDPTAGFLAEPVNVWFHGFGPDHAGWDVYNGSGVSYYTHDYILFWQFTGTWEYYNGTAWVPITGGLGDTA